MKDKSFIYINLNSLTGKYMAACLLVGNVVIFDKAIKIAKKIKNNKKENDQ